MPVFSDHANAWKTPESALIELRPTTTPLALTAKASLSSPGSVPRSTATNDAACFAATSIPAESTTRAAITAPVALKSRGLACETVLSVMSANPLFQTQLDVVAQ
jgi:hypothetical protein